MPLESHRGDHVHVALARALVHDTAAAATETRHKVMCVALCTVIGPDHLASGAQCGMISTSIGKYCGAPPSGGGPPITSATAGPSFCSMKRSKASRDSQMS